MLSFESFFCCYTAPIRRPKDTCSFSFISHNTTRHNTNAICKKSLAALSASGSSDSGGPRRGFWGFFSLLSFFLSFHSLLEQEPDPPPPPTLISRRTLPSRCPVVRTNAPKLASEWRRDFRQPHGAVIKRLMTARHFACPRGSCQRRRTSLSYSADERG